MLLFPLIPLAAHLAPRPELTFCCEPENDAFRYARAAGYRCARFDSPEEAFAKAPNGSGVLILASASHAELALATKRRLKVYVEESPDEDPSEPKKPIEWERVIVTSNAFGPGLRVGSIVSIGRSAITVQQAEHPWLVLGRVAGFDHLAFGMPKETWPILWSPSSDLLISSARLSQFLTNRFAPSKPWNMIWSGILHWVDGNATAKPINWEPSVRPSYTKTDPLPEDAEALAVRRATHWFLQSHLLMTSVANASYDQASKWTDRVGPAPSSNGDGSLGILEGYSSQIQEGGWQPARWWRRADCNSESAMALALSGDSQGKTVARRLADFIALQSTMSQREIKDLSNPCYGLVSWDDRPEGIGTFYGDDNARYILGLIATAGAFKDNRYDEPILRCILANFRTTGRNGFRGDSLTEGELDKLGWRHFFDADTVNMAPHFESYLWACYLWAYSKTGYKPLLDRTLNAIRRTVEAGENAWTWTNGSQQERARMLLCLSWLVRVNDTPEHRKWLLDMANKVISYQDKCGALREEFGDLSHGIAGPPRSNEAYGTAETPLIQENGDPVSDMLYTTNFAFLGLHEAAAATGDAHIKSAEDKLARFLCRIQIRSESHPEFNGAWFRAFDYGDWDYWASNADAGWGAWSIETGWSVSWITAVLALRQRNESLWAIDDSFEPDRTLFKRMGLN